MESLETLIEHLNKGHSISGNSKLHQIMVLQNTEARKITMKMNNQFHEMSDLRRLFSKLIGIKVDETFMLFPPFYTDFGRNISVLKNVFINAGCHFQDQGGITIGDGSFIGHNTVLATLNHGLKPAERSTIIPAPIRIGKNVWIGSNSTILSGVEIGDNAVIAAGAVVSKNVESSTVVGGVPAKKIKDIKY